MKTKSIWVTFQRIGFHCYPDAPDEVAYLRDKHRHVFHFKVQIQVFEDDREIEFHMFKNELEGLYGERFNAQGKSCEMLADTLVDYLMRKYPGRVASVDVSEDNECGASVLFS